MKIKAIFNGTMDNRYIIIAENNSVYSFNVLPRRIVTERDLTKLAIGSNYAAKLKPCQIDVTKMYGLELI